MRTSVDLPGTRQAHDNKNFTSFDGEVGVEYADGLPGLGKNFLLAQALFHEVERGFQSLPKTLKT